MYYFIANNFIEFEKGKIHHIKQRKLLQDTWEKNAMRNCMPEDIALLSMVMDDASVPKLNFFRIVSKLVNSLVPNEGHIYGRKLADDFENVIKSAINEGSSSKPRSLKDFIENGWTAVKLKRSKEKETAPSKTGVDSEEKESFKIVETYEFDEASTIFDEMKEDDLAFLKTAGVEYTSAKRYIESLAGELKAVSETCCRK